jgi:hypothetical protein
MFFFFAICLSSSCCWARKASISARVPRIFVSSISSTRPQSDGLLPPSSTAYRGALCLYKSKDFGQCKGLRYGDGQHCLNIVNLSKSEYCIHHERSKAKGGQRVPIQYHIQETKKATIRYPSPALHRHYLTRPPLLHTSRPTQHTLPQGRPLFEKKADNKRRVQTKIGSEGDKTTRSQSP